jgi:AcrR family transcriptional regulator
MTTRARILAASERLFAEQGYDRVSMPAIAEASGITAGAIYKHFASKEDLFFEVVRHAVETAPLPPMPPSFDLAGDLPRLVAGYTAPRLERLRKLAVEVHHASAKHPKVRKLLRRSVGGQIEELGRGIAASQAAGRLDASLDSELAATAVMVFVLGLMHMETVAPRRVGDAAWQDFVAGRVAALLGVE